MNRVFLTAVIVLTVIVFASGQSIACESSPVARISCPDTICTTINVIVGETVDLSGSSSYDPDNTSGVGINYFEWTFPDEAYYVFGEDNDKAKCKFYPASPAESPYVITLKVTDDEGWTSQTTLTVEVYPAPTETTWYVKTNGDDDNNGSTWADAFSSIQVGIDSADEDDTVIVEEGVYNESIVFHGGDRDITVKSTDPGDPAVVANTIIDGAGIASTVTFEGTETANCELKGFTIRDGGLKDDVDDPEPVAHWKLDETSGDAIDSSGNNHHGTLSGAPTWVPSGGKINGALSFDGNDDYIEMNVETGGYKGIEEDNPRTCAAWIKKSKKTWLASGAWGDIISWGKTDETGKRWHLWVDTAGHLRLGVNGGYVYAKYTNLNDGRWHHVAATFDIGADGNPDEANVTDVKLYVDGKEDTSLDSAQEINTGSDLNVKIGLLTTSNAKYFDGIIDDVRIYGLALGAHEISALVDLREPVGHWKFDESDGTQTASDSSGNDYDGTLTNMTYNEWDAGRFSNALEFDGTDDQVIVYGYKGITGTDARTCAAWIQRTGTSDSLIIRWGEQADSKEWRVSIFQNKLIAAVDGGNIQSSNTITNDGLWHHVAVTWANDGSPSIGDAKLYIDGQEEITTCGNDIAINTGNVENVTIGYWNSTYPKCFKGFIDDIRIYNKALTEAEVGQLYRGGGGIGGNSTGATIDKCVITENTSYEGGGIAAFDGKISNCVIVDNSADYIGGGPYDCSGTIENCVISANSATEQGGGLYGCDPLLETVESIIGHWEMDDNTTNKTVVDSSVNGNDGMAQKNTYDLSVLGKVGNALSFDGSSDFINLGTPATLNDLPTSDFTVSAWIYDESIEDKKMIIGTYTDEGAPLHRGWLLRKRGTGVDRYIDFWAGHGTQTFETDALCTIATGSLTSDSWHHLVAVWDSDVKQAKIYIDGTEAYYNTDPDSTHAGVGIYNSEADDDKEIGRMAYVGGIQNFAGKIDDVRIYNRELSDEETADLYMYGGVTIINCTIVNNTASTGGGLSNCSTPITNCIIWDNQDSGEQDESAQIYGGTPIVNYSCVQGWTGALLGTDNFGDDPKMSLSTYRIQYSSPCIDAGNGSAAPATDINGTARVDIPYGLNNPDGAPDYPDIGAYEYDFQGQNIINVDDVPDPLEDGSAEHPFDTIQEGINAASDGDTVIVYAGTYTGAGNRDIDFGGKAIIVRSTDPDNWSVVTDTVIDCEGSLSDPNRHRGFHFYNNENLFSVVAGLTIKNGYAPDDGVWYVGGAIFCDGSSPTITNCIITDNSAIDPANAGYGDGGGITCYDGASPLIANCIIKSNEAHCGGGVSCWSWDSMESNPIITGCVIANNTAYHVGTDDGVGGGISCWGSYSAYCSPLIVNCTFNNNQAYNDGGGISIQEYSSPTVTNCILWGNTATDSGDEVYKISYAISMPTFSYCDIKGSGGSGSLWNIPLGIDGGGNIDANPHLIDGTTLEGSDGTLGTMDDGLQLVMVESPCIDSADDGAAPAKDVLGLDRIDVTYIENVGTNIADMGAYESHADTDNDYLHDEWERSNFSGSLSQDWDDNDDDDDFSNLVEYMFGYDPGVVETNPLEIVKDFTGNPDNPTTPFTMTGITRIDTDSKNELPLEFYLNQNSDVYVSFRKSTDGDWSNPVRVITKTGMVAGQAIDTSWDSRDYSENLVERAFYDMKIEVDTGSGRTFLWESEPGEVKSGQVLNDVTDKSTYNPYKNIPVKIKCEMDGWCTRTIDVKKKYGTEVIHQVINDRLLQPQPEWNNFDWYGRWDAGKLCQDTFEGDFDIPNPVTSGAIVVFYDSLIKNLRCNPYRIIVMNDGITNITYDLTCNVHVTINIYDATDGGNGTFFTTLVNESQTAGFQEVKWNGSNSAGYISNEGTYRVEIIATSGSISEKVDGSVTVYR